MVRKYTITAFTENSPGVLHRINTLLTRRKVNIESLTVSETEKKGISRFTIVVKTDPHLINKVVKQIDRVIEVVEVFVSENRQLIYKEIAFVRVATGTAQRRVEVEEHAHRYGAHVAYVTDHDLLIEKTGTEDEINSLYLLLEPFGITEFVRSGRIAVRKTIARKHKDPAAEEEEEDED
ncbi:MAG TPA: acetolactate synthase small subunit [Oligoflexia bacterium]|nr:acetolactate synthase small subunit [Oligoflexia bacterium]